MRYPSHVSVKFYKNHDIFDAELCMQGLNLLGHAQLIDLTIGSQCGGHGICGADRVRLKARDSKKVSALTKIEKAQLTADDIEQGVRLACQCYPNQDGLTIEVYLDRPKVSSTPQQ